MLAGKSLLFVKRATYDSNHYYDEFNEGIRRFGGGLYVLSLPGREEMGTGTSRETSSRPHSLLGSEPVPIASEMRASLREGIVDRYDLSFDARRIVFDYKPPQSGRVPHLRDRQSTARACGS